MPSKNRRVMLTIPPELAAALDDYKAATGTPGSKFIVQMMVECIPAIEATTAAIRAVESNQSRAVDIMSDAMSSAFQQGSDAEQNLREKVKK